MQTFKQFLSEDTSQQFQDVNYDNRKGWGAVPLNADIGYFGLELSMKASKFLEIAVHLAREDAASVDAIKQHLASGGSIGTPFLDVQMEDRDGNVLEIPRCMSHEGRNRVYAIMELYGADHEILVHVIPTGGMRKRHITQDMIDNLMSAIYAEKSDKVVRDPFIKLI